MKEEIKNSENAIASVVTKIIQTKILVSEELNKID